MSRKLFTKTFGCQMNTADSDEMGRHLKDRGFESTEDETSADLILVNTCTVRELAEHKAMSFVGRLKEWKKDRPEGMIIVTGCAAERAKEEIKQRFPFIDAIVGAKDIEEFAEKLNGILQYRHPGNLLAGRHPGTSLAGITKVNSRPDFNDSGQQHAGMTNSSVTRHASHATQVVQHVTIMRGCNYSCSYCIVPAVRGREVYIPVAQILKETEDRVREGAKEVWLLGQTVNSYRPAIQPRPGYDFSDLLRDVAEVPGVERIRFISPHPYYLTEKLVRAMSETKRVCEHIHLPVQSGSDTMLSKMRRNYTRNSYMKGIHTLKKAIPDIALSTDIIVGFPGETEKDYQQTLSLVKEAHFDFAYCFKYSPRPGTASAEMADDVPEEVKEARVNELLALTDSQGTQKAAGLIGSIQEVLIEQDKGGGLMRGKTRGAWRVRIKDETLQVGDRVWVKITGTHSRELHGVVTPAKAGAQVLNLL